MKVHMNLDGYSALCGMKSVKLTDTRAEVTCGRCQKRFRETFDYEADHALGHLNSNPDPAECPACAREHAAEAASSLLKVLGRGRCECSLYYFELNGETVTTGCTQSPRSAKGRFAQGHDQKLVGLKKKAAAAGAELQRGGPR